MTSNTRAWVRGIIATVINSGASGVILIVADPATFNLAAPAKLLMTTAVFALLGLANYLKQHPLPEETVVVETKITHTGGTPPAALVFLVLALSIGAAAGCAGHRAPISVNPTVTEIDQTRKDVIRAIEATTTALNVANIAVAAADELNKSKVISNDVTRTIATAGKAFATGADLGLKELENVGTNPNLVASAKRLIGLLDPFLVTLEQSKNEKLQAFATSLRIGMTIVRTIGG